MFRDKHKFDFPDSLLSARVGRAKTHYSHVAIVDRSIINPDGVIKDVLLQFCQFILPVDFIIRDYEADEQFPFILG